MERCLINETFRCRALFLTRTLPVLLKDIASLITVADTRSQLTGETVLVDRSRQRELRKTGS